MCCGKRKTVDNGLNGWVGWRDGEMGSLLLVQESRVEYKYASKFYSSECSNSRVCTVVGR